MESIAYSSLVYLVTNVPFPPGKTWPDIFSRGTLVATVASGAGAGQQEKSGRHMGPLPRPQGPGAGKTVGVGSETWTYGEPKMTLAQRGQDIV